MGVPRGRIGTPDTLAPPPGGASVRCGGLGQRACFGEDEEGELYVCAIDADEVRKLAPFEPLHLFAQGFEGP